MRKKLAVASIVTVALCALCVPLVLFALQLNCNLNPDHVDLSDGTWKKLLHFETQRKRVKVFVYENLANDSTAQRYLIVREGVLPFGVRCISPVYDRWVYAWHREGWCVDTTRPRGNSYPCPEELQYYNFWIRSGCLEGVCSQKRDLQSAASVSVVISWKPLTGSFGFVANYWKCEALDLLSSTTDPIPQTECMKVVSNQHNSRIYISNPAEIAPLMGRGTP